MQVGYLENFVFIKLLIFKLKNNQKQFIGFADEKPRQLTAKPHYSYTNRYLQAKKNRACQKNKK